MRGYIAKAVSDVVRDVGSSDPYEIAAHLGFRVVDYPFEQLKGIMVHTDQYKVIGLNSRLRAQAKRAVLAHELGHCILSPTGSSYFSLRGAKHMLAKLEREANVFAVCLLTYGKSPREGETVGSYARRLGIPRESVAYLSIHKEVK